MKEYRTVKEVSETISKLLNSKVKLKISDPKKLKVKRYENMEELVDYVFRISDMENAENLIRHGIKAYGLEFKD